MKMSYYLTFKRNVRLFDNATAGGSDNTTDPTAASVDPNKYLIPKINSIANTVLTLVLIVAVSMLAVYYFKQIQK